MNFFLNIFSVINLLLPVLAYGQLPIDVGRGAVVIRMDYISLDGDTSIFQNSRYELAENIVQRRAAGEPLVVTSEGEGISLTAYVAEPEYDIDTKNQTVYVRKIEGYNGQDTVILKDFSFDIFYRSALMNVDQKTEVDTTSSAVVERFGMQFKTGRFRHDQNELWSDFLYTNEAMPMSSPLTLLVHGFSGFIAEIDLLVDNAGVSNGKIKAIITDIK